MAHAADVSGREVVERVRRLAPFIAEHAEQAERERKPVDAVMAELCAADVFRAFVPRRFGGFEIDLETFIDVGLAVSSACTSTGWVTTFCMEHNWMLAQFPAEAQQQIFGRQPFILAPASISPSGSAQPVDGGYRITGRWAWGTGIVHADWVILVTPVADDPSGPRMFIVPRDAVEVVDTWNCSGMQGTGSNDIVVQDLFVPDIRSESMAGMALGRGSGSAWHGTPCYRYPMMPLLSIAAAIPAVGAAQRAVALFTERLGGRQIYGTATKQALRPAAQMRLGLVSVRVAMAETILRDVARQVQRWGEQDDVCPPEERARLRLVVAQLVRWCRDAITDVIEASGASAQMRTHPLQRIHRDVNTLSCHTVFDLEIGAENYGCSLLGLDPVRSV